MNYNDLNTILTKEESINNFKFVKNKGKYFGFFNGFPAFAVSSSDQHYDTLSKQYKFLEINTNITLEIIDFDGQKDLKMHVAILKSNFEEETNIFFRVLDETVAENCSAADFSIVIETLTKIFDQNATDDYEMVGLYGELFVLDYFSDKINLTKYWHTENNLKFDFSITEELKIEVKTTRSQERIHHFKHDQVNPYGLKVLIISVLLQKDDKGLRLSQLISRILDRDTLDQKSKLLLIKYNEKIRKNSLLDVSFNDNYTREKIKIFENSKVPKFSENYVEGVSNAEYDISFENLKDLLLESFFDLIEPNSLP